MPAAKKEITPEDIQTIINGQETIQKQLKDNKEQIEIYNASLNRIFRLYEKHDTKIQNQNKKIEDLEKWKVGKDIINGNTNNTIAALQGKDGDLETKLDNIQTDVSDLKVSVARIETKVSNNKEDEKKEEKKEYRKWLTKNNITTGITVGTCIFLITMGITFFIKTFI